MLRPTLIVALFTTGLIAVATPVYQQLSALTGVTTANATTSTVSIAIDTSTANLYAGSRRLQLPGVTVWMNHGAIVNSNGWQVAKVDLHDVINPLMMSTSRVTRPIRVMLDPGHGGLDGGAQAPSNKLLEKELTLDIAKRVGFFLKKKGYKVKLTRQQDQAISLSDRVKAATKWKAEIFVSIHGNSAPNQTAHGIETFVLPCAGAKSTANSNFATHACPGNLHNKANTRLGTAIQRAMVRKTRQFDRGVKRARYEVIRNAICPSALVEVGFLSNTQDATQLKTRKYRQTIAEAIAEGIDAHSKGR